MRRREFVGLAIAGQVSAAQRLTVPVCRIVDSRVPKDSAHLKKFHSTLWPEAVRTFASGGIDLQVTDATGELKYTAADRPIVTGARRGIVNLMVTDHIPIYWDRGREWAGVTTILDGCHICMIAVRSAHGNQAAFLSVNTCVHELLHAMLQDIYLKPPKWYQSSERELRVDWYATRMWLFHEGTVVRQSAADYLRRLHRT